MLPLLTGAPAGPAMPGAESHPVVRQLEVTVQDDALLLHRPPATVRRALRRMAANGADRVRITAGWSALAPRPLDLARPRFAATDSRRYQSDPIRRLDGAVRGAREEGLGVQLDLAFWAPAWAVGRPLSGDRQRWEPSAREFGRFVTAMARRYGGHFPDPDRPGRSLPAVRLWTTWNEPNHPIFLLPQWRRTTSGWRTASPHIYRRLHEAAYAGLKKVNAKNRVLLGGLAATGSPRAGARRQLAPLRFLRELACVDDRLRPLRVPECRHFRPLRADGFAHHPYSFETSPDVPSEGPDSVRIADLQRLSTLLDALQARGRIAKSLPIYLTEYGYESNPPDFGRGVPPLTQARYLGQATYLAWRAVDTRMFAQFLLQDIGPDRRFRPGSALRWHDFQTGVYYHDGRAKPALRALRFPFWAEPHSAAGRPYVLAFGQVRPGRGRRCVAIEALAGDGAWRKVPTLDARPGVSPAVDEAEFMTDRAGFFLRAAPAGKPTAYRARWIRAGDADDHSIDVPVAPFAADPVAVPPGD